MMEKKLRKGEWLVGVDRQKKGEGKRRCRKKREEWKMLNRDEDEKTAEGTSERTDVHVLNETYVWLKEMC